MLCGRVEGKTCGEAVQGKGLAAVSCDVMVTMYTCLYKNVFYS